MSVSLLFESIGSGMECMFDEQQSGEKRCRQGRKRKGDGVPKEEECRLRN